MGRPEHVEEPVTGLGVSIFVQELQCVDQVGHSVVEGVGVEGRRSAASRK